MAQPRYRPILGALSVISFAAALYILSRTSYKEHFAYNFCPSIISAFNIAIISGWFAFSVYGGVFITVLSAAVALWTALRSEYYQCSVYTLTFFAASFLGYHITELKERTARSYRLRLEKYGEEMNVLSSEIAGKGREISAIEKKLLRYYTLKGVSEALSVALTLEGVTGLIIQKAHQTLGRPGRVLLYLVDASKQELELAASRNAAKVKEKKGDIFDRWVLKHRRSLMIEDCAKDFRFPGEELQPAGEGFKSLIATPLMSESKVIGILRMDSPAEYEYTQDDLRLLDIISDLGAVAIQNAFLYSKTQELAIKDSLTGLAVRRYFLERFREDLKRAARSKSGLAIIMMDIDHFKDYNDKYGHAVGDLILKHIARTIRSMVREGDIVARYGGEEIVLLLFGADKKRAALDAEAIRKRIEKQPLALRREMIDVTASIGVAAFPEDAAVEEDLIKVADERLYKAKSKGRNRVCAD